MKYCFGVIKDMDVKQDYISRILIEHIEDLVYILNNELTCESVNLNQHLEKLGYSPIGKKIEDFIFSKDLKKFRKFIDGLKFNKFISDQFHLKTFKKYQIFELRGKRIKDKLNELKILIIAKKKPDFIDDEASQLQKQLEIFKKVAEQLPELRYWQMLQPKDIKAAFQKTREMLDLVIDNIPHLIFWKDINLKYLGCNRNFALINNLPSPNLIYGKTDEELLWIKKNIYLIQEKEKEVIAKDESEKVIEILKLPNGEDAWFEVNRVPLHDEQGLVLGILSTYNNITERVLAEQKIKESELKYRTILESMKEGYFELDLKGNYTYVNKSYCDIIGYNREELMGQNFRKFTEKKLQEILYDTYSEVYRTEKMQKHFQFKYLRRDQKEIVLESSIYLKYDANGKKIGFSGIINDITEKYYLEEKIKRSERKFRHLFENAPFTIFLVNLEGEIIDCNSSIKNIEPSLNKDKIIGNKFDECFKIIGFSNGNLLPFKDILKALTNSERFNPIEASFIKKDGSKIWLTLTPSRITLKNLDLIQIIIQDVTQEKETTLKLKESEEKLKEMNKELEKLVQERTKKLTQSEKRYRHLYDLSPAGILLINDQGKIFDINSRITELFGYKKDDLIGKHFIQLFNVYPKETREILKKIPVLIQTRDYAGFFKPEIIKVYRKNGSEAWIETEVSEIPLEEQITYMVIVQNITDKKIAEEKLRESERILRKQNIELKELDKLKTDFISMAAHELKTPLIPIRGYTELTLFNAKDLSLEVRDNLKRVLKNTTRLETYINQLLDVLKIDAQKMDLNFVERRIYPIIQECLASFDYQKKQKNLNVIVDVAKNIKLKVDPFRISQVFSNILSNAIKYSPLNGNIEIAMERRDDSYVFKIKDEGKGLEPDEIKKIFHKFVSINKDLDVHFTFEKGSGLGLYIAKGIINAHGGKIWVESKGRGKGATFFFTLPIK